ALTTSGLAKGSPTSALWLFPETSVSALAAAASAVSVNDTVTAGALWSAARIVAGPATDATGEGTGVVPALPVGVVALPWSPPPGTIVQSTCGPVNTRAVASVAFTTSGAGSCRPTSALWLFPETSVSALATAARAVSVNETVTAGAFRSAARIVAEPA